MRKANVGDDPELVDRKVAPALKVVTHCGLNGNLSFADLSAGHIFMDSFIAEQLHNHLAAVTPCFASFLELAIKTAAARKSSHVILYIFFALCSLRNNAQAENNAQNIVALGNGI